MEETDEYLAHYGVLGMKWGVRKDPDKTYHKAMKKLGKLNEKSIKAKQRLAKKDSRAVAKRKKAESYQSGAGFLLSQGGRDARAKKAYRQAAKAGVDASRAAKKQAKYMAKAQKWARSIDEVFEGVKVSNITPAERQLGYEFAMTSYNRRKKVNVQPSQKS